MGSQVMDTGCSGRHHPRHPWRMRGMYFAVPVCYIAATFWRHGSGSRRLELEANKATIIMMMMTMLVKIRNEIKQIDELQHNKDT